MNKKLLVVVLSVLSIGLLGYYFLNGQKHKEAEKNIFRIALGQHIRSLEPRIGGDLYSASVIRTLFDGLMREGLDGGVYPSVAEKYEVSEDGKIYTFYLRPSYWTDGQKVTAYDFAYAWKKAINPKTASTVSYVFYSIKNARKILGGEEDISTVGIYPLAENILQVHLEYPASYFQELVASPAYLPIQEELDKNNPDWMIKAETFVSNGPFKLSIFALHNHVLVEKNDQYWDRENVRLDGVNFLFIDNPITILNMFENGELDWAGEPTSDIPLDVFVDLLDKKKLHSQPVLCLSKLLFNTEAFPFNNIKMRKAFSCAIHRSEFIEHVLHNKVLFPNGYIPTPMSLHEELFFEDGNIELAQLYFQAALDELGIQKEDLPRIKLNGTHREEYHRLSQVFQQTWQQAFGISIDIEKNEWGIFFQKLLVGEYQIGLVGWHSWLHDPIYFFSTLKYANEKVNFSRWENPAYRDLLDASDFERNPEKRNQLFIAAERILFDEMPFTPLYFRKNYYLINPKLHDVIASDLNLIDCKWAYFEDKQEENAR